MALFHHTRIVTNGLVLYLDAANRKSYPGSGSTWFDLMGNYNFTLSNTLAFQSSGFQSFMNFETYGSKYLPGGVLTDVDYFSNATICIFSEIKDPDTNWKTLIRATQAPGGDHQIIIQNTDGISLGMYDNGSSTFQDTGLNMNTLPNYNTQFNYMAWKLSSASPYYQFYYNNNLETASAVLNSSVNQQWQRGFASIGAFHNNTNTASDVSQQWGKISVFMYYNRHLTADELRTNFNALRWRYNL